MFGVVSVYKNEMRNLIDPVIDPADSMLQFQNISKASAQGLDLELNARIRKGLHGCANYAFQRAEAADSQQKLTNSPSHLVKVGLSYPVLVAISI